MFFFFKQKTAYEMRISDWSSDVCSSDLPKHSAWSATNYAARIFTTPVAWAWQTPWRPWKPALPDSTPAWPDWADAHTRQAPAATSQPKRSEERRGGKECDSTGRSRWEPVT